MILSLFYRGVTFSYLGLKEGSLLLGGVDVRAIGEDLELLLLDEVV